jgi:hypothetical protein
MLNMWIFDESNTATTLRDSRHQYIDGDGWGGGEDQGSIEGDGEGEDHDYGGGVNCNGNGLGIDSKTMRVPQWGENPMHDGYGNGW